ncbi:hypothetical protein NPX13_g6681 [Xylaria arbuscula]|uniref:Uncharacterized protein n=1 Tax=Xylaria arbuscula TaxID=114810 RepID=A0A9W8NBX3_9PEZI|nr:hypothetical protein NPX13_g6681 [Xylaria arbuscula]
MQSVPSLVGAGTAVAAAATGLVFGQLVEGEQQIAPHNSSGSIRRKLVTDHDFSKRISFSRPGTSSAASTASPAAPNQSVLPLRQSAAPVHAISGQEARLARRASRAKITPTKSLASRHLVAERGDPIGTLPIAEDSCDSASSNGSWMRRLTIRPLSQHGSIRSSIGPDSPSLFSFGSAAPILSSSGDSPNHLPPNKLVKRAPGTKTSDAAYPKRRGSRAQMTIRRPATSHQRSATLQHQLNAEDLPPLPKFSFDHSQRPRAKTVGTHQDKATHGPAGNERSKWKSFWHTRLSSLTRKTTPLRGTNDTGQSPGRRVRIDQLHTEQVYLVTPNIIMSDSKEVADGLSHKSASPPHSNTKVSPQVSEKQSDSPEVTPSKPPKRSISMQFSSPTDWIARTGSLRRRKRGTETTGGKRHVSAPIANEEDQSQDGKSINREKSQVSQAEADLAAIFRPPESTPEADMGLSSPLPPLSRLSSFHLDTNGHGPTSPGLPERPDEPIVSPSTSSRVTSHASNTRTLDRASTVGSSEYHRGFTSGDDDDTDFITDTPFDSFRTVASGRKKGPDSPLESMFDDSPPSTAGNNTKPKRLSIQEIMGPSFDISSKIIEEDEHASTPIPATYEEFEARFRATNIANTDKLDISPVISEFPIDRDYTRLSFDDDDDLGWAREDETEFYNHLSPPSSMNSRRGSPKFRRTLGRINGNSRRDVHFDPANERPRSTVFDWTEPTVHDKREKNGYGHRPKTVHGKQEIDLRGGRSASRKNFVATHVRSQSVPVVPDPTETAKSAPKFGTWGLGQKTVSEDWDDDFEFEEDAMSITGHSGKKPEKHFPMFVPASIQATQPTVKAHSGQIRELSLLVNDLKRLCRLGREMNISMGSSAKLWHEAEGIIALASPDEDTEEEANTVRQGDSNLAPVDERFIEQGFDGASLEVEESQWHRNSPSSRRRSVFSPDDDIFGTWDNTHEETALERPRTPENRVAEPRSTSVARSVMESMRKTRTAFDVDADESDDDVADHTKKHSNGKVNFDTNSLKELVKRAGDLRDSLSELVRREDHITQSPARTPKRTRADGSPAFTRVFDEPTSSPTRRVSHSPNKSVLGSNSVGTSPSNGISRRMQMMIVR